MLNVRIIPTPMIWEEESHSCSVRAPGDLDSQMVFWLFASWKRPQQLLPIPWLNLLRQTSGDVMSPAGSHSITAPMRL